MWTIARNGAVHIEPTGQVLGPKVLLLDPFSASDGDIVAYRFRKHKLGPIIGMRSWGGVVGIRGTLPLLDGGFLNRSEFSRFDLEAKEWIMEGQGVEPDIVIDNDPAREFAGMFARYSTRRLGASAPGRCQFCGLLPIGVSG